MNVMASENATIYDFPVNRGMTNTLRQQFLAKKDADLSGVRPIVARSWYRSRAAGVDASIDRGRLEEGRVDEQTMLAAEPHLRRLDEVAADMGGYVSLTSPNGVLVKPEFLRADGDFPEGYSLLEESCGSNGEGLALEEGRGVWLAPEEHFREDMRGNWCFASLIRDPFHNRVRAVIGLTFPAKLVEGIEPSSTLLILEGVASRIEREIEARTSSRERALLSEYLTVSRRRGNAFVIAMDGKNSIMNSAASNSLEESDYSVIAGYAKTVMSSGQELKCDVLLQGAGSTTLEISPVQLSSTAIGAITVVRPHPTSRKNKQAATKLTQSDHSEVIRSGLLEFLDGTSLDFHHTLHLSIKAVEQTRSVLLIGELGSGKRRIAEAISSQYEGRTYFVDAAEGIHESFQISELLKKGNKTDTSTIILENAQEISTRDAQELIEFFNGIDGLKVILTSTRGTNSTLLLSEAFDVLEISVSPLRNRREDIPLLAQAIAREAGTRALSSKLISKLTSSDWPRNIDQLKLVLENATERAQGTEVSSDDIPQGYTRALSTGRLSRLEDAELSEMRSALKEARGNRRLAADILQIGRSTLYRRMDYFRSRGFDF